MAPTIDELVDMTAAKLEKLYREIDEISLSPTEEQGLELLDQLDRGKILLFPTDETEPSRLGPVDEFWLTLAWRQGMDPESPPHGKEPTYAEVLHNLILSKQRSHAETFALDLHSVSYLNGHDPIPTIIRSYIAERILALPHPKNSGGRTKTSSLRNYEIVSIIEDLAREYRLPIYGKIDDVKEQSACWIVAEAQKKLGRQPQSPSTVAKLYLAVNREASAQGV